jgi:hypothetical protein
MARRATCESLATANIVVVEDKKVVISDQVLKIVFDFQTTLPFLACPEGSPQQL